ncbi:4Fe-4S ferredoxin, iron-sulpur binding domain-containing protein [Desulfovibrio sp. X2]|uniref:4Fe-4S dicluster domain-containing protein n=1 Tax=Desulfovibrio sp. X2 TaxID=941449 RepID=UPI000358776B|nr:4Fe-4S dicluster domain-containing protein [Desulfovibrio sp. X2]EPR37314.1 4Fe-4S ferredoxin, iron-sulpur binding domain-containing protein [Desulfovibrio sp. X2]
MGKSFFIDLTRCTACRGCQVACKQWHKLPANETKNWGSHQNPRDLEFNTYKLVRFHEVEAGGGLQWLFFPDQCRHCVEPPCKAVADGYDENAILKDETTGAVLYTERTKVLTDMVPGDLCPYDIPRRDEASGMWNKCDMCYDRVHNGLLPACVHTCPTGAMNFGDREDILAMANKRLDEVKKRYPKAVLANPDSVRVIFLCHFDPTLFHKFAVAEADVPTGPLSRRSLFASLSGSRRRA